MKSNLIIDKIPAQEKRSQSDRPDQGQKEDPSMCPGESKKLIRLMRQSDWDYAWRERKVRDYLWLKITPSNRRLARIFKHYLKSGNKRILEIGCAPGRWLIDFHQQFGFQVFGIDYSMNGCKRAREALKRRNITGNIIYGDVLDASFQMKYEGYFDVVYSLGFIEHFADPLPIINTHLKLLKKGGIMFITMPNYGDRTLYRKLLRISGREKETLMTHNVKLMKIPVFKQYLTEFEEFEILTLSYIGPIDLGELILTSPIRLLKLKYPIILFNIILGYLTFFLNSEILSPHLVLIARKLK